MDPCSPMCLVLASLKIKMLGQVDFLCKAVSLFPLPRKLSVLKISLLIPFLSNFSFTEVFQIKMKKAWKIQQGMYHSVTGPRSGLWKLAHQEKQQCQGAEKWAVLMSCFKTAVQHTLGLGGGSHLFSQSHVAWLQIQLKKMRAGRDLKR